MKNLSFKKSNLILLIATLFLVSCSENSESEILKNNNDEFGTMLLNIELNSTSLKNRKGNEIYISCEEESNKISYRSKQKIVDTHNSLTIGGRMVIANRRQKLFLFTKVDDVKDNLTAKNFNVKKLKKSYKITPINSKCLISVPEETTETFSVPKEIIGTFEVFQVFRNRQLTGTGSYDQVIKDGEGKYLMEIKKDGSISVFNTCYKVSGIKLLTLEYDGNSIFDVSDFKISLKEGCEDNINEQNRLRKLKGVFKTLRGYEKGFFGMFSFERFETAALLFDTEIILRPIP